jgi:branched-chain amino acid aminotransferase
MIWVDGTLLPRRRARIDPTDRGFTLGDGLFETLAAENGKPLHVADHLARLSRGADELGIPMPFEAGEIAAAMAELMKANELTQGLAALRVTLSRGVGARGLLPPESPSPTLVIAAAHRVAAPETLSAALVEIRRNEGSPLSRLKSLNYLDNVLAQQAAVRAGAEEALMLNNKGRVVGFARGNIFALIGDGLMTPPLADGVLDGITRHRLIRLAGRLGLNMAEHSLDLADLDRARGLLVTNSLLGAVPLARLDRRALSVPPALAQLVSLHRRDEMSEAGH